VLYQLSYTPPGTLPLFRFPVQLVLAAPRTELVQLHPARVVLLVLPRAVRALLADGARQADHGSILGLGHLVLNPRRRPQPIDAAIDSAATLN
jgi:hypothetical protein